MDYLFSQYTDNSLEQMKLLTPCSGTIWGTSSSAEFGLFKKYKNPKCSEGVVSVEVDVLIPPGGHAQLWAKPAEDGSGVWQELGAGEKCAFWLKILPREVWRIPEPAMAVPLGGRVALPGQQPRWPALLELLCLAQRPEEHGRKALEPRLITLTFFTLLAGCLPCTQLRVTNGEPRLL